MWPGRHDDTMLTPGAEIFGQVCGREAAPRDDVGETRPSVVPVPRSSYEAAERIPGVGSWPAGLDLSVVPSPPWLPFAQTVRTPLAASWSCRLMIVGSDAPQELLTTLIGGQVDAGTPGPHGAAWCCSTQLMAFVMPINVTLAEITTSRAPGAAPPTRVPSVK